ncbi:MAG: hypothetical protein M3R38_35155 [Actinomycetota bacterium]|nr:hypothetical protein [Actinomycetota bacterium]
MKTPLSGDECDHAGPVPIEPEEGDGEGAYRANCPTRVGWGPPRATPGDALDVLPEHGRQEERGSPERPFLAVLFAGRPPAFDASGLLDPPVRATDLQGKEGDRWRSYRWPR